MFEESDTVKWMHGSPTLDRFAYWVGNFSGLLVSLTSSQTRAVSVFVRIGFARTQTLTLRQYGFVIPTIAMVIVVHHASVDEKLRIYHACLMQMSSAEVFNRVFDVLLRGSKCECHTQQQ
jgi:hypothetical protein